MDSNTIPHVPRYSDNLLVNSSMEQDPETKFISLVSQLYKMSLKPISMDFISVITQTIYLLSSMDLDSQPAGSSELMSLISQAICFFNAMDLESQPEPLKKVISIFSRQVSLLNSTDFDLDEKFEWAPDHWKIMSLVEESFNLKPQPELISLIRDIIFHVISVHTKPLPDTEPEPEAKLISSIIQLISDPIQDISVISQIVSLIGSVDFDSSLLPTELMSLITRVVSVFSAWDLESQPDPLKNLLSHIFQKISLANSNLYRSIRELELISPDWETEDDLYSDINLERKFLETDPDRETNLEPKTVEQDLEPKTVEQDLEPKTVEQDLELMSLISQTLSLEPEPEFISIIYQICLLVTSMLVDLQKFRFVCPQVQVTLEKGRFRVMEEEVTCSSKDKWKCLPTNWMIWSTEETVMDIRCPNCNGENHGEHEKMPLEIKHSLHPKHSLQLVLLKGDKTRECYCCDQDLQEVFYYCSTCDYAMNMACVDKPRLLSVEHLKWHEHTLAQFPTKTSLPCNVCALTHPSCPYYICPPCDFVIHQKCISLPRVIRISRHGHRIRFTASFDNGVVRCCGVCRRQIDSDYGGYSCNKDGCLYAAHSKCATQRNVWDGKDLEGEPEEDLKELEPFVRVRDGIIRHFSHQHHNLRLYENTGRDYDENKLCQACITPIYFGNFYSCMQCDFILHEECANLSRRIHHPIHPHLLTLVGRSDIVMDATKPCSACPWRCTAGFYYECSECSRNGSRFKIHVQCATISEPLVHESHMHPLFLTSKPEEERRCCVCKESGHCSTNETFNCIECEFSLCFKCATLPQRVRYKFDKHILTLSYGEETSPMAHWCELCEKTINQKERFYMCDEYCCDTLHIECMLGVDLYMKPGSFWLNSGKKVGVLPNNHHMSRPNCSFCKKRCPHRIVFQCFGLIFCSTSCIHLKESGEVTE